MVSTQDILRLALDSGILNEPPQATVVYDLDEIERRVASLQAAFPVDTLHALAIKACPIAGLLRHAAGMGCGAEAASEPELQQALRIGIAPDRIVFDSPAKTVDELRFAIPSGVHINADSLQELDRIAELTSSHEGSLTGIGVRINPGLRAGSIEASSTAMPGSKFGVSLADDEDHLLSRFERYPWLTALHLHIGSQGCDLDLLTDGAERLVDFVATVESRVGEGRIKTLDIGGGLPVAYRFGDRKPGFGDYARALNARVPRLLSGKWRLITEFGRAIWANAGFALSRIEYTKTSHGHRIALAHLGADMFVRPAYVPDLWYHEVSVFDPAGRPKSGAPIEQDIAGPLCFSGDLIAKGRMLPPIEPGDYIVLHDAGAYTLSMWSRYNSRVSPSVHGCSKHHDGLVRLRAAERTADVLRFWD